MKDWKTTFVGIFATIIMVLGVVKPEIFDEETQELSKSAFDYVLVSIGAIINLINAVKAKDPK
jgi:hypothetical protein